MSTDHPPQIRLKHHWNSTSVAYRHGSFHLSPSWDSGRYYYVVIVVGRIAHYGNCFWFGIGKPPLRGREWAQSSRPHSWLLCWLWSHTRSSFLCFPYSRFLLGLPTPLQRDPRCCSLVWVSVSSPLCTGVGRLGRKMWGEARGPPQLSSLLWSLTDIFIKSKNQGFLKVIWATLLPEATFPFLTFVTDHLMDSEYFPWWGAPYFVSQLVVVWTALIIRKLFPIQSSSLGPLLLLPIGLILSLELPWTFSTWWLLRFLKVFVIPDYPSPS